VHLNDTTLFLFFQATQLILVHAGNLQRQQLNHLVAHLQFLLQAPHARKTKRKKAIITQNIALE
jgi:hypothetical protein